MSRSGEKCLCLLHYVINRSSLPGVSSCLEDRGSKFLRSVVKVYQTT